MQLAEKIELLSKLGLRLENLTEKDEAILETAYFKNRWFVVENTKLALANIRQSFLKTDALKEWTGKYNCEPAQPKQVAIIMAGNIPLVGIHDLITVFLSGHFAVVKLSDKDQTLIPWIVDLMEEINPAVKGLFRFEERLKGFDAVIATGSNNTARYFEEYFSKVPNIIRKNRNAIAVLKGEETREELRLLGKDVFEYFGLGCRSVSKIYVPKGYDFNFLMETFHEFNDIVLNNKYKNNFDYNYTLFILNSIKHFMNGCILVKEDELLQSRIGSLHYEFYDDQKDLETKIQSKLDQIQCVVGTTSFEGIDIIPFGKSQEPSITQYADGVDTMAFLQSL